MGVLDMVGVPRHSAKLVMARCGSFTILACVLTLLRSLLLLVALWGLPNAVCAQEGISQKQQEKNLAKKGKDDKKAKAKKEKDDRKRHLAIQDKSARKRIRHNTKRADRGGSGAHRDSWPKRMFVK